MRILPIYLLLAGCLISCNKSSEEPPNINELKAIVVLPSGDTVDFKANGSKVSMGCETLGSGSFVNATNESNAAVYISFYNDPVGCIGGPGTYRANLQYLSNANDQSSPIYGILGDSITITSYTDQYMAGYFSAVCKCISLGCVYSVDSVIITGTFQGN